MVIYIYMPCRDKCLSISYKFTLEPAEDDDVDDDSGEGDKKKKKKKREAAAAAKKSLEVVGAESFPNRKGGSIKKKSVQWSNLFGLDRKKKSLKKKRYDPFGGDSHGNFN